MSNPDNAPNFCSCGCCEGEPQLDSITNRPGLNALSYRLGTYGEFVQRLLDQIRSATIQDGPNQGSQPLAGLTTRALDDPSIALLDAWAVVADVLTFYQERIANEGYLRTATERRSVLELARAIGYELNPGVAANAYLQFTVEEIVGAAAATGATPGIRTPVPPGPGSSAFNSGVVDIPQGTQVQSVPAPGKLPQTFETAADFQAHAEWNQLSPRLSRRADLALSNGKLYLIGDSGAFQPGTFIWLQQSSVFLVNPPAPEPISFAGLFSHGLLNLFKPSLISAPVKAPLKSFALSKFLAAADPVKSASLSNAASSKNLVSKSLFSSALLSSAASTNELAVNKVSDVLKIDTNLFLGGSGPLSTLELPPIDIGFFGPMVAAVEVNEIYLQGTSANLKIGDRMLMVGTNSDTGGIETQSFIVRTIDVQSSMNRTRVEFVDGAVAPSFAPATLPPEIVIEEKIPFSHSAVRAHILEKRIGESDLQVFLQMNNWDASDLVSMVNNPPADPLGPDGAFAFRATAGFFGHNAQVWKALPDPSKSQREDPYPRSWDGANNGTGTSVWTDSQSNLYQDASVFLERSFPQILADSWALFESKTRPSAAYQVIGVAEKSLSDYGMSGKSTGLALNFSPDVAPYDNLGGICVNNPAVVSWGHDRLDVFVLGTDHSLFHKWWDGGSWGPSTSGFEFMGGTIVGDPAVVSWDHDRLDVFVVGTDGSLFHKAWDGSQWHPSVTGYENLGIPKPGVTIRGNPVAVSWDHDRLDIFVIGTDGALYHKSWNGQWGPSVTTFEYLGGVILGDPTVVSWDHDRLDIFVIGTNLGLFHKAWDGTRWAPSTTDYDYLGRPSDVIGLARNPAVNSWGHDRLDIFAVGTDGALYHKWWGGNSWGPSEFDFEFMGGTIVGDPAVVSWDHDRLDVFVIGTDNALYHKAWNGSQWSPSVRGYEFLSGSIISNPAVASWDHDRLDVFVIGSDRALYHKAWDGTSWGKLNFPARKTTAYIQSEQLTLVDFPIDDDIPADSLELMLDNMVVGLKPGQPMVISGLRSDLPAVAVSEVVLLADIVHVGGFTVLKFGSRLKYGYLRTSVAINANVALATHGATVQEVLGNGDGSQINQSFNLKRIPLTYVSAPTPSGSASSLQVRVNDLEWNESPSFYGLQSADEKYVVRLADDSTPTLTFGDPAARLQTGQQNVRATYRTGIGLGGNVDAGSLSMLQSRPPGLRAVTNPLAASGGADPQDLSHARTNAPLTVLTLDRIVSLDDYENFAQAFAGIGKAQAVAVWSGEGRLVHITVAQANGGPVDPVSPLYQTLLQAIQQAHDPVQTFMVDSYQPLSFNLTARLLIDQPRYIPRLVMGQVSDALKQAFSFEDRSFAQAVTAAEIVALIQLVPGVVAINLTQLYFTTDSSGPSQIEPPPFLPSVPAGFQGSTIKPAQLLLLNPLGVALTEIPA